MNFSKLQALVKAVLALVVTLLFLTAAKLPSYDRYIDKYSGIAVSEMMRSGVPASITLAQGLLESNAGQSSLAVKGNNHFGIKCHNDWTGRKMYHDDDRKGECFRVYASAEASFRDHSDFLRYKDRYKQLFELKPTDYKGWARGLKKAGYATAPDYAEHLIRIIESYGLSEYDRGGKPVSGKNVKSGKSQAKSEVAASEPVPVPAQTPLSLEKPVRFRLSRLYTSSNGVPFVYAARGETYSSIAKANSLFLKEILKYNDLKSEEPLKKGTIVYLQPKKNRAAKGLDKYVVGADGESLRDISQRFGIRLSSLVKRNSLAPDYVPSEGDMLKLR